MEWKVISFWCERCREDFRSLAAKRWLNHVFGEVWEAKCPKCSHPMRRLINNAPNDRYYRLSRKTREEARRFEIDTLQVNDSRFDIFYPSLRKKNEEKRAEEEINQWKEDRSTKKSFTL